MGSTGQQPIVSRDGLRAYAQHLERVAKEAGGGVRNAGRTTLLDGGREYKEYRACGCVGSGGAVVVESADDWGEVSSVMIDE